MSEQIASEVEFVPQAPQELPLPEIPEEVEAEAKPEPRKPKPKVEVAADGTKSQVIVVDGKEFVVDEAKLKAYYNFAGDEPLTEREFKSMLAGYKQHLNYDRKNRDASTLIKQVEGVLGELKNNTKASLRKLFADNPQKLREEIESLLLEELETEMLDPKEKELREYKRREEEWKQAREREEQARRQAEEEARANEYSQRIEAEIMQVLDSSNLPKTRDTVIRIADYLLKGLDRGISLEPKQVVQLVREDIQREIDAVLSSATEDQLIEILGEERLKKIRQADLKRLKTAPKPQRVIEEDEPAPPQSKEDWQSARDRVRQRIAKLG